MVKPPYRVLLVDDSAIALVILQKMLATSPEIQVVGTAKNGKEALKLIPKLQPHVVCTDLHMPHMNGEDLTRSIMRDDPRPILVISTSVREDSNHLFRLLEAGALDFFPKPCAALEAHNKPLVQKLVHKIKVLSGVVVIRKHTLKTMTPPIQLSPLQKSYKVVAIGASTGGPLALKTILSQLPDNFPVPIVCIQHINEEFLDNLVDWLKSQCKLKIKIAEPGEYLFPATVYLPPKAMHLELDNIGRVISSTKPAVDGHCPSVTVTFNSMAQCYGKNTLGVLLTGMGKDGAQGLKTIVDVGGMTVAQDEQSCVVFGMPKEAIELGAAQHIVSLNKIAPLLQNTFIKKTL